jgi:hypothetical protein
MDDWKQPLSGPARVRTVSDRVAPNAERPAELRRPHLRQPADTTTVIVVPTQPQKAML